MLAVGGASSVSVLNKTPATNCKNRKLTATSREVVYVLYMMPHSSNRSAGRALEVTCCCGYIIPAVGPLVDCVGSQKGLLNLNKVPYMAFVSITCSVRSP